MVKKPQQKRNTIIQNPDKQEDEIVSKNISQMAHKKIEESLKDFSKLSNKQKEGLSGNKDFLEQFWAFFKEEHPNLLDEIHSQEQLNIYVQNIGKKGFLLDKIMNKSNELHEEFKETNNEKATIIKSLKEIQNYCDKTENKMPANIFKDFANNTDINISPVIFIKKTSKITKIGNLFEVWKKYIEDNGIILKEYQKSDIEKILCPSYLPTERLLISATIKKIKKNLPNKLIADFETDFKLPIDIHSPFENLNDLKQKWILFLDTHKNDINEDLAKNLDKIFISNSDIYEELRHEGESIKRTKGFSQQTKNFRRIFNKLATRQFFDEANEKGTYIQHNLEEVSKEFKSFPPYFNELLRTYHYNHQNVIEKQPTHKIIHDKLLNELGEKEKEFEKEGLSDDQKENIKKEILSIKKQIENRKRKAYAEYIKKQDPKIGSILDKLVDNKFDISKLEKNEQQEITNALVSSKLKDSVKNQIPDIIGIDKTEYENFIKDIFDLDKKEIIIPTQYEKIPITFTEKSFFGGPLENMMEFGNNGELISNAKNLPLNLTAKVTEQNKNFFEENIIFNDLFSDFQGKNKKVRLNDSYRVRVTNQKGETIEGYLSEYPPTEDIRKAINEEKTLKEGRFLYSHPITRPEDAREIVKRNNGSPAVILKDEEKNYDVDILSKQLNLNGEAISGLLFSYPLGQYNIKNNLSQKEEQDIARKFGNIKNIYRDTTDNYGENKEEGQTNIPNNTANNQTENSEKDNYEEFLDERKTLKGYQEEEENTENQGNKKYGFQEGAKLLIQSTESGFMPEGGFEYFTGQIKKIDKDKGKCIIKFTGNGKPLGKYEGTEITVPLTKKGLQKFKETFEENKIFKLPDSTTTGDINKLLQRLEGTINSADINKSFGGTDRDGNNFILKNGTEQGEIATHFGIIENIPGEDADKESQIGYMYEIKHDANKKGFKITANDEEKTSFFLDYPNFILFVAEKKLQPQSNKTAKKINTEAEKKGTTLKPPKKRKGYSIASIIGLFKNFGKKIGEGLKKYEEEQVDDLTDTIFYKGKFFESLGSIMPTAKLKEAFENAGHEYRNERDNKTYKKIEKYLKIYEADPDFGGPLLRGKQIAPYLNGEKKLKDHHQGAAMLLATIKKGKGPYSRNTDRAGKGRRIKLLFGDDHQKRYLIMKEKLEREVREGIKENGQTRADEKQNEILKLEMKYMVHCIDGRQLQGNNTPILEAMYSKKYAGDLETESNKFFSETVSSSTKEKGYSFELARFEYFRLLGDRPQQALPNLKQMAIKAVTKSQRDVIKTAILTGMLSGIFYSITTEDKKFIQQISRSLGFLPGILIRDPNHHQKIAQLIKIATGDNIPNYDPNNFGFGKMASTNQIKNFVNYNTGIPNRLFSNKTGIVGGKQVTQKNIDRISDFVGRKKNTEDKTLIKLLNDDSVSNTDKTLLNEIYGRSLEKNENLDKDVNNNGKLLEQNILSKNQSHINEIIGFESGDFKGKDEDDRQNKIDAREAIRIALPKGKIEDKNEVISYVQMFMNRFEDRGLNTEEKKLLIRTLLTIKDKKNDTSSDEMLRYVIIGNIVRNSGHGGVPDKLIEGLEVVKDFFKNNLEIIIQEDVIEKGFGSNIFVDELAKGPYKVGDRGEYVDIKTNRQYMIGLSKEEQKRRQTLRSMYNADELYINEKIYSIADQLYNRNYVPNKFKKYYNPEERKNRTTQQQLQQTLQSEGIKIKDRGNTERIRRILSGEKDEDINENEILQQELLDED